VTEEAEKIAAQMLIDEDFRQAVIADYDRRRRTRWGRFLLWLLRKTT
jgi:Na+/melibiose symporter-like transporter